MAVTVRRCADPEALLEVAGDFLIAREAEHTILFSVLGRLRRSGEDGDAGYLAALERNGEVIAVAGRSPPLHLVLSTADDPDSTAAFAEDVSRLEETLPGAVGPEAVSAAFAAAWTSRTGAHAEVAMRMRLFECDDPSVPDEAPGRLRPATASDRDLLIAWLGEFEDEATPHERRSTDERAEAVDRLLAEPVSRLHLWDDDGQAVSMAVHTDEPLTSPRVGGVYTPPAWRRRGYAGACVAAVTRHLLDAGHARVVLFTDLANPTSNRVYTRIGYRPLGDFAQYAFA